MKKHFAGVPRQAKFLRFFDGLRQCLARALRVEPESLVAAALRTNWNRGAESALSQQRERKSYPLSFCRAKANKPIAAKTARAAQSRSLSKAPSTGNRKRRIPAKVMTAVSLAARKVIPPKPSGSEDVAVIDAGRLAFVFAFAARSFIDRRLKGRVFFVVVELLETA